MILLVAAMNGSAQKHPGSAMPEKQAQHMKSVLSLSDEQYERVKALNEKFRAAQASLLADTVLTREEVLLKRKRLMDERDVDIKDILTGEQYAKWDSLRNGGGRNRRSPGRNAMEAMKEALDLSDEQVKEIQALNSRVAGKMREVRTDSAMTRESRPAAMKNIHEERRAELKKILTDVQYEKLLVYEDQDRRRGRRGGRP